MEENNQNQEEQSKNKLNVRLTDKEQKQKEEQQDNYAKETQKQYKKWVVYALMGLIFAGSMYLLFFMDDDASTSLEKTPQEMIPEPTDITLLEDKGAAYENAMTEKEKKKRRNALQSLGDWGSLENDDNSESSSEENDADNPIQSSTKSYRNIHQTLDNFYEDDSNYEQEQMQQEIEDLREQLAQKEQQDPLEAQMALMEKSYEMANKYMPQNAQGNNQDETPKVVPTNPAEDKEYIGKEQATIYPVYGVNNSVVSKLPRAMSDSLVFENWIKQNQRGFNNMESQKEQAPMARNSIKACIHTTQKIDKNNRIPIRLLEPIRVTGMTLPKGTILTAFAKIGEGRLLLDINSLEYQGRIVPVSVTAYDLDGQRGLYIPYTPGANAFREIAAGLSQSSGTNYNFSSSAKDQIISEVGKGVLQGTSSYISKKIAQPKIKVKAGYQLLLVSKS